MFETKHFRKLLLFVLWIAESLYLQKMKTNWMVQNVCLLFMVICLCGCASQKYKHNLTRTETFDVDVAYKQIARLPFNKRSEPYVTCLKNEYANAFSDVELAWKCVVFRERLAHAIVESDSIHRLAVDSLNQVHDDTLKVWLKNLMTPPIPSEMPDLSDTIHLHIQQTIFSGEQEAIVIEGGHHRRNYYHLRKEDGLWKIYSDKDPEHRHDHD